MNLEFAHTRVVSCFIDHLIFTVIAGILSFPGIVFDMISSPFGLKFYFGSILLNTIGLSIYLSKDLLFRESAGKKLLGLKLIDAKTGETPNPIQLVVRNITFLFWPIEVFLLLIEPQKRLGDYLARTQVVPLQQYPIVNTGTTSIFVKALALFLVIFISYCFVFFVSNVIERININSFAVIIAAPIQ